MVGSGGESREGEASDTGAVDADGVCHAPGAVGAGHPKPGRAETWTEPAAGPRGLSPLRPSAVGAPPGTADGGDPGGRGDVGAALFLLCGLSDGVFASGRSARTVAPAEARRSAESCGPPRR